MVTDASIAEKVDRAIWNNGMLRSTDYREIDIAVKDGIVLLSGHVISTNNQRQAEAAARAVPGVREVTSHLVADDKIVREVALALGKLEHVYENKLFTGVHNGIVVLTGAVGSASMRSQVEKYAANIPEVRGVINSVRAPGIDLEAEDQRFLQPSVGEQIYFSDNLSGKVEQVIVNPNNRRVVAMVMRVRFSNSQQDSRSLTYGESQIPDRLITIPMTAVNFLTKGAGFLKIDSSEAARYSNFDLSCFVVPQADWRPPYPYRRSEILFPVEFIEEMEHTNRELATL